MSRISRRALLTTGLGAVAGAAGLGVAARVAGRFGLIPPDSGVLFGSGEALTYATHRLLTRHTMAREFPRDQISKAPFANGVSPLGEGFARLQHGGFADWRLKVDGLVARPQSLSLADLRRLPASSQITSIACEEGWSYIAEWSGVPLSHVLTLTGASDAARYVVYRSVQQDWWESIDMADAWHPQTILALGMNGADLPVPFGGPLRLRVPRQLGYKSLKYVVSLTLTDDITKFGSGLGSAEPDYGYSWYGGI
jgi:DMSO/TMAO reductase YedYZ molybdopterin-dependent catalytic subunit